MPRMINEILKHHGIKGMQWGVRRYRGSDGRVIPGKYIAPAKAAKLREEGGSTPTVTSSVSDEHMRARILQQKPLSEMSNIEIKQFTERMNLERQYQDLTKKEISKGRKMAEKLLTQLVEQAVKDVAKSYVKQFIEPMMAKKTST